ncbi:MAG: GAF domain-containing protein, partial [Polyangiales bacterium]
MEPSTPLLIVCESAETRRLLEAELGDARQDLVFRTPSASDLETQARTARMVLIEIGTRGAGPALCARVHEASRAPIMALAARADDEQLAAALGAGAEDFVLLPPRPGELLGRIHACEHARPRAWERAQTSEVLLELTRTLVSSLDFQEILYILVSRIATVIDVDRVSIVLVPDEGGAGFVVAASDDQKLQNLRLDLAKYPEIRHALKTRKSLTIHDVDHHPLLDEVRRSVSDAGLSALTLVPIVWEEQPMGVLFVRARTHRGALSPHQLEFCEVLANATAVALRNARVLQTLRDETQRDVHARIEAEKRLSVLKRYADLLSSAADGLAAFDLDGRLMFANPAAHATLGYEAELALGRPLWDLVPPPERRSILKLRQRLAAGEYPHNVDVGILHKNGKRIVING